MNHLPWSGCDRYLVVGIAAFLGSCMPTPVASENAEPVAAENVAETPAEIPAIPEPTAAETEVETGQYVGGVLFACQTADGKVIEVHDKGNSIEYVFGPKDQLELVLDVPREQVSTYQWQGIGRYENYSVSIPNGDTVYSVFWARDRLAIDQPPEAGVSVEIDGDYITTVDCATEATHNLIGVDLPPTPL